MKLGQLLVAGTVAVAGAGVSIDSRAEFPGDSAIRLLSPYGAGGAIDITARILSSVAGEFLGTRIDVVGMAGANGQEAINFVKNAKADGYTLLITDYGPLINTALLEQVSYKLDDWVPIVQITEVVPTFFARADGPYKSFQAWMDAAKAKPKTIKVAHGRHLSVPHMPLILLEQLAPGFTNIHLPTTGGGEALAFVLGRQVDIGASVPSTISGGIKGGTLVALAVASESRVASLPQTPTLRELGHDVVMPAWYTVFAHRDVPKERMKTLEEKMTAALKSQSAQALGARTGTEVKPIGMEGSAKAYQTTIANLGAVLKSVKK